MLAIHPSIFVMDAYFSPVCFRYGCILFTRLFSWSVLQWDLVCEQNFLVELSQMLFMFGLGISDFFITAIADYFGRKRAHIGSCVLSGVIGVIVAVMPAYPAFAVLRFFLGLLADVSLFNARCIQNNLTFYPEQTEWCVHSFGFFVM